MKERIERLEQELAELKAGLKKEQGYTYWVFDAVAFTSNHRLAIKKVTLDGPMEFDDSGDWRTGNRFEINDSWINKAYISDIGAWDLKRRIIDMIEVVE